MRPRLNFQDHYKHCPGSEGRKPTKKTSIIVTRLLKVGARATTSEEQKYQVSGKNLQKFGTGKSFGTNISV